MLLGFSPGNDTGSVHSAVFSNWTKTCERYIKCIKSTPLKENGHFERRNEGMFSCTGSYLSSQCSPVTGN